MSSSFQTCIDLQSISRADMLMVLNDSNRNDQDSWCYIGTTCTMHYAGREIGQNVCAFV